MFANPTTVGISQRVVATLVASAMLLASIGYYNIAQAANLVDVSDTLSDSEYGSLSNHTVAFTIPNGSAGVAAAGGTITVQMPTGFNFGSVAVGDIDLSVNGVDQTLVAGAPGASQWGYTRSGQTITFTTGTGATATQNQPVIIRIGTNATGGTNQIQNPNPGTPTSYELYITAGTTDSGRTRIALIKNVLVSAIVDTSFTFTITGLATTTTVNTYNTTGSTTPTAINFARLVAGAPETLAQRLNVTTNANNGFTVTVAQDSSLQSANGADIDSFSNGTNVNTPTAWSSPTNNIALENTWGHWGLTSNDDLNANEFGSNGFVAASTTPRAVFHHDGPANGSTADVGQADVAYRIEITPLQEAADDYNTTLTYVATPIF